MLSNFSRPFDCHSKAFLDGSSVSTAALKMYMLPCSAWTRLVPALCESPAPLEPELDPVLNWTYGNDTVPLSGIVVVCAGVFTVVCAGAFTVVCVSPPLPPLLAPLSDSGIVCWASASADEPIVAAAAANAASFRRRIVGVSRCGCGSRKVCRGGCWCRRDGWVFC
jgi:hypothetical protein